MFCLNIAYFLWGPIWPRVEVTEDRSERSKLSPPARRKKVGHNCCFYTVQLKSDLSFHNCCFYIVQLKSDLSFQTFHDSFHKLNLCRLAIWIIDSFGNIWLIGNIWQYLPIWLVVHLSRYLDQLDSNELHPYIIEDNFWRFWIALGLGKPDCVGIGVRVDCWWHHEILTRCGCNNNLMKPLGLC